MFQEVINIFGFYFLRVQSTKAGKIGGDMQQCHMSYVVPLSFFFVRDTVTQNSE